MNLSLRRILVLGLLVAAGLLIVNYRGREADDRTDPNSADARQAAVAETSSADGSPTGATNSAPAAARANVAPVQLWAPPDAASVRASPPPGSSSADATLRRIAALDSASMASPAALTEGALVRIPGFNGEVFTGRIHRRQVEASGLVIVGGDLTGSRRGTFSFSSGAAGLGGMILLPEEKRALVLESTSTGPGSVLTLTEKPISEVICSPYPTAETRAVAFGEESPGSGSGTAVEAVPILSSRPAAIAVLYMDFDGETVNDPHWNGGQVIEAKRPALSAQEIVEIWERVAEDYAGFDVGITTDVRRYNSAPVGHRMRCIVTPTDTAARGAGGVAYLNSFSQAGEMFSETIPCWVFNPGVIGVAEAVSHELGHTLGLRHDGRTSPQEEYYMGHGEGPLSWAPIMGVGYYKNVVQWSCGEYRGANNQEDDIAVIASAVNAFGYSADEAGDTPEMATALPLGLLGDVSLDAVIQSSADTDEYRFNAPSGRVALSARPAEHSPNADLRMELLDEAGTVLASADSETALDAKLEANVALAGTYFIRVSGAGHGDPLVDGYTAYGSTGAYSLTGAVPVGDGLPLLPTNVTAIAPRGMAFIHQIRAGNAPTSYVVSGLPAGLNADPTTGIISGVPSAAEGSYTIEITATNPLGTNTGSMVIELMREPVPTISLNPVNLLRLNRPATLQIKATALPESYSVVGLPPGLTLDSTSGLISGTPSAAGSFPVTITAANVSGSSAVNGTIVVVPDASRVAAGYEHMLMIRADGSLWASGDNRQGQLGDGTTTDSTTPVKVAEGVKSVATTWFHSLFLLSDGTLWGMGSNSSGQLGDVTEWAVLRPTLMATDVLVAAAGDAHTLFLKTDGTLWGLGSNAEGQLGAVAAIGHRTPVQIATDVVDVSAAGGHSLYVKADGSLWASGANWNGQLGDGSQETRREFVRISENIISVAAGGSQSFFVSRDAVLWGAGWIPSERGGVYTQTTPVRLAENVTAARPGHTAVVFTTVDSVLRILGVDGSVVHAPPGRLADSVSSFAVASGMVLFTTSDGRLWGRGSNRQRLLDDSSPVRRLQPIQVASGVAGISAGPYHSLYVSDLGELWGFGQNSQAQLGDGSTIERSTPAQIATDVRSASGGSSQTLFVTLQDGLYGAGYGWDARNVLRPELMMRAVGEVSAGGGHSLLLRAGGELWTAGSNDYGQLGDGSTTWRRQPVLVDTDIVSAVSGSQHSFFIKADGSLWGMGRNYDGQLGDGTKTDRLRPVQIATGVHKVAAWERHSLFIKTDGTLWGIGAAQYGQLGTTGSMSVETPIAVASDVTDAAAGENVSFFVTRDSSLWVLGKDYGAAPVRIALGVERVSAKGPHALFLKRDHSLWALGDNQFGQLGDGAVLYCEMPVEIVPGRPGVVSAQLPAEVGVGSAVTFSVSAHGDGPLSYQWRKDGVAIAGANGATYSIAAAQAAHGGSYDVVVTGAQGTATSETTVFSVVGAEPHFVSSSTATFQRLTHTTFQLRAANEPTEFTASGLPAGLTLQPDTGLIAGIPDASAGVYTATVGASNGYGSTTALLSITVTAAPVPQITMGSTKVARRGQSCAFDITATALPHTYGAVNLPEGLVLTPSTGRIAGTPTCAPGVYSVVVSATNESALAGSAELRIAVLDQWQGRMAGYQSTYYVDDDGILWAAGENRFGQLGDGTTSSRGTPVPVASEVVSVATSGTHALFVTSDGELFGMGWNVWGELGLGNSLQQNRPVRIATDVIDAAAGGNHSLYVKSDGSVWSIGANNSGQLGDGTQVSRNTPATIAAYGAAVGAGSGHSLIVKRDGTLWATGNNFSGQLGTGTYEDELELVQVASDVESVAASLLGTCFRKRDGSLWGMGFNGAQQLKTRSEGDDYEEPLPVKVADDVGGFSAGANQTLFLDRAGTLSGRGFNQWGQLGDFSQQFTLEARTVANGIDLAATGYSHSFLRKSDGTLWAVGSGLYGELADGTEPVQWVPLRVAAGVRNAVAGESHSLFLTHTGVLWAMGYNELGSLGDGSTRDRDLPVRVIDGVSQVTTGYWHSLVIKEDGSLWGFGNNQDGQLANGTSRWETRPMKVMDNARAAATGSWHSVILKTDGTVWAVGWNGQGQLGDGSDTQRIVPVHVMSDVVEVAAGARHTLFLKSDGSLWATGDNSSGQLGDGAKASRNEPVSIATDVAHIAAGGWHTLFIKDDGTLWGVGYNQFGQLGDGGSEDRATAVEIDTDVQAVWGGLYHTQYLKKDGTLWAMGQNDSGQLGDGTAPARPEPSPVSTSPHASEQRLLVERPSGVGLVQASAASFGNEPRLTATPSGRGSSHSPVGETDFLVTSFRAAGDQAPQTQRRPVMIATGVSSAAAGGYHSLYVRRDGSLWAMGLALFGRLGHGGGAVAWEPTQIHLGLPTITSQSIPCAVSLGEKVELSVTASGVGTLSYQWRKNGEPIAGATADRLSIMHVTAAYGGVYDVVVTNLLGSKACTAVNMCVVDAAPVIHGPFTLDFGRLAEGFEFRIGANNDATRYTATGLPAGLVLDSARGSISGRIDAPVGPVHVTISATNANGTDTAMLTINVQPQPAPVITSRGTVMGREGQWCRFQVTAANSPETFSAAGLPAGLSIDSATGLISGKIASGPDELLAHVTASSASGSSSVDLRFMVLGKAQGLAAGNGSSYVIDEQGALWAMGANGGGQLGDGSTITRVQPVRVTDDVVAVAAAYSTSLILKSDGSLYVTGFSHAFASSPNGVPLKLADRVRSCAVSSLHCLWIDWDGTLKAIGLNPRGQLGDGTRTDRRVPISVALDVAAVAAGWQHSLFVKTDGTLWAMGANNDGQLGDGTTQDRLSPVKIATEVSAVAAGMDYTLFVRRDHTLWGTGANWSGSLGIDSTASITTPVQVASGAMQVSAQGGGVFVGTDGNLWASGGISVTGWAGQLWKKVVDDVVAVASGSGHVLYIDNAGALFGIGQADMGQLGDTAAIQRNLPANLLQGAQTVSAGSQHTTIVKDGLLWGLGSFYGVEGREWSDQSLGLVVGNVRVSESAAAAQHTVYIEEGGTLRGFGFNLNGQLGPENVMGSVMQPTTITGDVCSVSANYAQTLFIKSDQSLWGVGENSQGQLGNSSSIDQYQPVRIASEVLSVSGSGQHTLFLKTDGALWGTGLNDAAELSENGDLQIYSPVKIADGVIAAAAANRRTHYVTADGVLWGVGINLMGQLGDGTKLSSRRPVKAATGVASVWASDAHTVFLKTDGTLWAMGSNVSGQLGDGTLTDRLTPVLIATGVRCAAAVESGTFFIKRDSSLWAVGKNSGGRMGVGLHSRREFPVRIITGVPAATVISIPVGVNLGGTAMLKVEASGTGELHYQWRKDGKAIVGANSAGYFIGVVRADDGGIYDVVITGDRGTTTSVSGQMTVLNAPPVLVTSSAEAAEIGKSFSYQISANNDAYQFAAAGLPAGLSVNSTSGTITGAAEGPSGVHTVTLTAANDHGVAHTMLDLAVTTPDLTGMYFGAIDGSQGRWALQIRNDHTAMFVAHLSARLSAVVVELVVGNDGVFTARGEEMRPQAYSGAVSAMAAGNTDPRPALSNNVTVSGRIAADGTVTGTLADFSLGDVALSFSGIEDVAIGAASPFEGTHTAAALGAKPGALYIAVGASGRVLVVSATSEYLNSAQGTVSLAGEFRPGESAGIPFAVTIDPSTYAIVAKITPAGLGSPITFMGLAGSVAPAKRLVNISSRAAGGNGNNVAIGGFVIAGSAPKRLLLRAVGPTLITQGLGEHEVMLDPMVNVYDARKNNAVIAQIDNWGDNADPEEVTSLAARLGATALAGTDANSAAVVLTLDPGVYTFIARGQNDATGIVLVEAYDADAANTAARLMNISTRAYCTTGNGVSIGGFVVSGNAPKRVLLRALGPTLATKGLGIEEVLQDPQISVHDARNANAVIATNDNWGENVNSATVLSEGARLGATPLAANDTTSSALLLTLKPGVYTFIASGKSNSSGIVLIEVYDAD